MISGTIKASKMKLCIVIILLKTFQNTEKIKNMTYDVTMTSLLEQWEMGIRTSLKPDKLYVIRKVMMRPFGKCNFY